MTSHIGNISFKDYYYKGYASVTYLVPKKVEDDIFTLTKDVNIFMEKEENYIKHDGYGYFNINLKTPKFNSKSEIDFEKCLNNLGFGEIFDKKVDSFKNAFDDEKLTGYNIDVYRNSESNSVEEDVDLKEFADEIEQWVIDALIGIGCDTAKQVLAISPEEVARRADLEIETVNNVFKILKAEF